MRQNYRLMCKDTLLGVLIPYEDDFPWVYCHFQAQPSFATLQPLFDAEQQALDAARMDIDAYEELLEEMGHHVSPTAPLRPMIATFLKVTASYWPGLFHCYDIADLPRTNNDLEHVFGSTRYHERRAGNKPLLALWYVIRA